MSNTENKEAPKPISKLAQCRRIVSKCGGNMKRATALVKFQETVGCTKQGASTYFALIQKERREKAASKAAS